MPEYLTPDAEEESERQEIEIASPSALAILNQSEHAAMVQTANLPSNRRKLAEFESRLMAYANHSQPIAISMFYSLPRSGKQIIGPSIRFAEIVAPCWKNCAVGSRVIGDADRTVTGQGIFIDFEANLRNSVEVPRRITDKDGKRYSDDMVVTTANAAMSVARRNSVLKGGVPQALWFPAYEQAQLTAVGKAMSHAQRVAECMEYCNKLGVTEWQILNAVGVPSIRELETEHLVTLRVLVQEIKRGEKTIEEVFGSAYDKEIEAAFEHLHKNAAQRAELRRSHGGRAKDLLEYLKSQLGPTTRSTPVTVPHKTQAAPAEQKQTTPAAEKAPDDGGDVSFPGDAPVEKVAAEPGPELTLTNPEEKRRGRGRPTREEAAAKKTQEKPAPEPQEQAELPKQGEYQL
jgi:hypothetical protein